ncbi:isotrichodermin C-15 hydroxylase [Podospora didyma]|uniref:Isotrichodermin C-15 hydroxylase n=1 Tax=Podospora didyma TaxID=330526 RepID=A0AAE0N2Q7_9PEZI|nr:isotrichodermin C-15 hydroxylase [Podospora didyma]
MISVDLVLAQWASPYGIFLAVILLISIIPLTWFVYNVYFHPLAGFPGPLLHRGSMIPKIATQLSGNITNKMTELHRIYGPVVRVAPSELSYTTVPAWKDIYTAGKDRQAMTVNTVYGRNEKEFFGACSILWQSSNAEHARHRRVLAPAFSEKALREHEPIILHHIRLFIQRMRENACKPVDLCAWFNFVSFDIIGDLTFGESFDCLEQSKYHPWIWFIFGRLKMMMYSQVIDTLGILGTAIQMSIPQRIKDEVLGHVAYSREKISRRQEQEKETGRRSDFMTHILRQVGESKEKGMITHDELVANAQILVMAGSETTATLLAAAAYYLMRNPQTQHRLEREIRSAFANEGEITAASTSGTSLPYLLAVLNEALRMHPPLPTGIHRIVPDGGAIIDGQFVAAGTDVIVHQWAAYRAPENFTDPDLFVPERWLPDASAGKYAGDNRDVFQPFSVGPRSCIGRSLAYIEARIVFVKLLWNFDMELNPESKDWADQKTWVVYEKLPLMARLTLARRE